LSDLDFDALHAQFLPAKYPPITRPLPATRLAAANYIIPVIDLTWRMEEIGL